MKLKKVILRTSYCRLMLLGICSTVVCFLSLKYVGEFFSREYSLRSLYEPFVQAYLVDTPGCKIPHWDIWDPSVKKYFKVVPPYKCSGKPSFLTVNPNAVVSLDNTILQLYYEADKENVSCNYGSIRRGGKVEDFSIDNDYEISPMKALTFDLPLNESHIKAECLLKVGKQTMTFHDYLPLTPLIEDVETRCKHIQENLASSPLNVMFIGLDSVSLNNFNRHFRKTNEFITKHMSPFTLKGYTKVGENTFPNIVPLLTGEFYEVYWNETTNKTMYFDDLPYLWKKFAKLGFRTLLAEDHPDYATFNYFRSGFKNPPADYYYRPFALAVERSISLKRQCIGSKMEMNVVYDYVRNFLQTMNHSRPFFAYAFLARMTHDVLNYAGYADEPTYEFIKFFYESHFLNNTLLIFFSDHGIRFSEIRETHIGHYEERMPFMHLMFPQKFLKQHKQMAQNLETNQKRLTTPFDIYATILDLLNLPLLKISDEPVIASRGISLFREISPFRTCEHAAIPPHYCTCQIQIPVPLSDESVIQSSGVIVSTINDWLGQFKNKCSKLILHKIHSARISTNRQPFSTTPVALADATSHTEYIVVVSTSPGFALFEATVCFEVNKGVYYVLGDISRINLYGNQSSCITDTVMKKYCYCSANIS